MSTTPTITPRVHVAWRHTLKGSPMYVESIRKPGDRGDRGDRYNYTGSADKALKMTDRQCRDFCAYMRDCATVGFWS